MITTSALSSSSMDVATNLLDLLGLAYAEHKLDPFSRCASVLRVELDLTQAGAGKVLVKNKPSRVGEVSASVEQALQNGTITTKEASRLETSVR